jgi:hypothetical protein
MKPPSQALADARIRVAQIERQLIAARLAEVIAENELARAEAMSAADTVRPPADTTPDLDGGWS